MNNTDIVKVSKHVYPKEARLLLLAASSLLLSACGGGGGGAGAPSVTRPPVAQPPVAPTVPGLSVAGRPTGLAQLHAPEGRSPVFWSSETLHVGGDIGTEAFDTSTASVQAGIARSFQDTQGGPTPGAFSLFLAQDAQATGGAVNILHYKNARPTVPVRPVRPLSSTQSDLLLRALQIINEALPGDFQLAYEEYDPTTVPDSTNLDTLLPNREQNRILVRFAPKSQWLLSSEDQVSLDLSRTTGLAYTRFIETGPDAGLIRSALVQMPDTAGGSASRREEDLDTLVHELMHTLGRRHPVSASVETIMRQAYDGKPGHILFPLDTDGLHAVYEAGRLTRGQAYTQASEVEADLGPWTDTRTQLLGRFTPQGGAPGGSTSVDFGAQLRNGQVRAFARGPVPETDYALGANNRLGARYTGILAGFLHSGQPLDGTVSLDVEALPASGSLFGDLGFRALQSYDMGTLTGPASPYAGGSLDYRIEVLGNTFHEVTRPDPRDRVDGAFFGTGHSAMGGVLQRRDATAGFGGERR